jgi:DNA-binding transcriptional MerR regulator
MLIGEFARKAGVAPSRVRFYEARGLLPGPARLDNGYRDYGAEELKMIGLIDQARTLGFSLAEVRIFMSLPSAERRAKDHLIRTLEAKLAQVEAHLKEVKARRSALVDLLAEVRRR